VSNLQCLCETLRCAGQLQFKIIHNSRVVLRRILAVLFLAVCDELMQDVELVVYRLQVVFDDKSHLVDLGGVVFIQRSLLSHLCKPL
jgi:hypothetical protein